MAVEREAGRQGSRRIESGRIAAKIGTDVRHRVLVVDDSAQNRLVAGGHLELGGYTVSMAASGEEALAILGEPDAMIDLVVLDILMPGIGGIETCKRIRATPVLAEIPVLFLTALGARDTTEPALDAGADDLLAKPFNRAELLLRVRALIRQRKTANEMRDQARVLAAQNEQLRRMEHDKRKMTEMIVHDLKGPIGAILGNAEMMSDYTLPHEVTEALDDMMVSIRHLDRTTRDMLDLSRAAETGLVVTRESFDLEAVAQEVAASLRSYGRWTNVRVEVACAASIMTADRELVRRILQNLVHNAIKHSPRNAVVMIESREETDAETGRPAVVLRVVDEGSGVKADQAQRIFDSGVSMDGSHGLGLAFCRLAAEAHGGSVWVERREPRGSTFHVRLPTCEAPSESMVSVRRNDTLITETQ